MKRILVAGASGYLASHVAGSWGAGDIPCGHWSVPGTGWTPPPRSWTTRLFSRHRGELLAFFNTVMTREAVGPATGTHHLSDECAKLVAHGGVEGVEP